MKIHISIQYILIYLGDINRSVIRIWINQRVTIDGGLENKNTSPNINENGNNITLGNLVVSPVFSKLI